MNSPTGYYAVYQSETLASKKIVLPVVDYAEGAYGNMIARVFTETGRLDFVKDATPRGYRLVRVTPTPGR